MPCLFYFLEPIKVINKSSKLKCFICASCLCNGMSKVKTKTNSFFWEIFLLLTYFHFLICLRSFFICNSPFSELVVCLARKCLSWRSHICLSFLSISFPRFFESKKMFLISWGLRAQRGTTRIWSKAWWLRIHYKVYFVTMDIWQLQ